MVVLRRKQAGICCVLIMALVITAGCAPAGEGSTSGAAGPGSSSVEAATKTDGDQTIYDCAGTRIGIPTQYLSQLIVSTDSAMSDNPEEGIGLISVREKASVEAAKTDFGEEEMGFLFSIQKLTRAGYEHYVCGGGDGCQAFARDGKYYYIFRTATDVQFYRSGGKIDTDSPDWKNWETLMDLGDTVQKDVMARNGLSAYSDQEFFSKEFTYSGNHAYVNYYPYVTVDGSKQEHETFVLSQPAGQGDGGIWCVERIYNEYGDVRPYYPSAELIGSFDVTAEEYYSRLQKECDAGSHADLLTPLGAAKWLVSTSGEYNDTPASSSLASVTAPDAAYMDTNQEISRYVSMLMGGRSVDPEALLACAGGFTPDSWGVLGRFFYGSDWWPPLQAALKNAALGENQELRDRDIIHLYQSYSKSDGPIAEGLAGILTIQREADQTVFDKALAGFADAEQAYIRSALTADQN